MSAKIIFKKEKNIELSNNDMKVIVENALMLAENNYDILS